MSKKDPIQIGSDLLLLHEGPADGKVIGELMRQAGIQGYQTIEVGGNSKLRALLKALVLSPHFKNPVPGVGHPVRGLAIVMDAETDMAATFQSICGSLGNAGLSIPANAGEVVEGSPKIGVFLVPDNQSPGKIETLCLASVCNDPAWQCLDVFFSCVKERGGVLPVNMDKARAQAFLATRANPALPVGLAAEEGYWKFDNVAFDPLKAFLQSIAS